MVITFGSLFAGIGGIDLGLERAGMECSWQIENDPYCVKVLEKHWPEVQRYEDIRRIDKSKLPYVDLISGGFPCQPFSSAGKRKGTEDDRWLWPEFHDTIRHVRPKWVLVENVPGLLSIDSGRVFAGILRDLAALGYDAFWISLRASDLGAPHRRERVFVVAYSDMPTASRQREHCGSTLRKPEREKSHEGCCNVPNSNSTSNRHRHNGESTVFPKTIEEDERLRETIPSAKLWSIEPDVGRVADGISSRVDRLKGLGNAVVPQVAEYIGRCIMEANNA